MIGRWRSGGREESGQGSMRRPGSGVLMLGFLSLAAMVGCGKATEEKAAGKPAAAPPVPVVAGVVEQRTVPIYTELTARTDANDSVELRARVRSFLAQQHFTEGTMVRKGQLLFTLDAREFEAQMMQAKASLAKAEAALAQARESAVVDSAKANLEVARANLNKAEQDVKRLQPLAERQAVPQQDYDNALAFRQSARAQLEAQQSSLNTAQVNQRAAILEGTAAVESAKASVRQAELNIEFCRITSPIDGLIGARQVAPGNLVGSGEPTLLATVSNVNPMRVFLSISEADYLRYSRLRQEKKSSTPEGLDLLLADGSTFPYKGRVIIADRAVDLKTGTLSIIAEFPNPNALLRPGQFGRVRLAAQTVENALLIPQKAVMEMQSAKIAYAIGPENKIQLRSLQLGERVGDSFIVTEGLKAGERIVVEGILKVRPGATVTPVDQPLSKERPEGTR